VIWLLQDILSYLLFCRLFGITEHDLLAFWILDNKWAKAPIVSRLVRRSSANDDFRVRATSAITSAAANSGHNVRRPRVAKER